MNYLAWSASCLLYRWPSRRNPLILHHHLRNPSLCPAQKNIEKKKELLRETYIIHKSQKSSSRRDKLNENLKSVTDFTAISSDETTIIILNKFDRDRMVCRAKNMNDGKKICACKLSRTTGRIKMCLFAVQVARNIFN